MGVIGWVAAFLVFIVIEVATMALTTIWFAGGDKLAFEKILHKPAHVVHSDV